MSKRPAHPKIYHIAHEETLAQIVADGYLRSDREVRSRGGPARAIGMSEIKRRRLEDLAVSCHDGTMVGDYVPFYFCPRSVMLYLIYRANHPELTYHGGQDPIVHLEFDLEGVICWCEQAGVKWAFSLSNAGASYAEFRAHREQLGELDWVAIGATDFTRSVVKEGKQAEFLVHERVPFHLVERIGVRSNGARARVQTVLSSLRPRPPVEVLPAWYY